MTPRRDTFPPYSATQDEALRAAALLPAGALERRDGILLARIADAEIADEPPFGGDIERLRDTGRIENRDPPHAEPFGARRQPDRVHRGDNGIFRHLRHRAPAEAAALRRRAIGEDREMQRRLV